MAADIGELGCSERKRKRKRPSNNPKLLVDDEVEVRSVEEGFQGSWHSGIVTACEHQARRVQYDHLLHDDGSQNLIECIKVHPVVDGVIPASRATCNYRGLIRPLPPPFEFGNWSLHYGQCVDVYYQEAWWEGVIFDHEDGSEDRIIFFPDMGDEMQFRINMLRITLDWDEFTDDWKPRGNWLFFELIEEFEQEWPLQVSVRQIWYEVRGKKGFQELKEWTSTARNIWKYLVWEVIFDNFNLTFNQFFHEFDLSGDLVQEALPPLSETPLDVILKHEADSGNSLAVIAVENDGLESRLLPIDLANATVPEEIDLNVLASNTEDGRLDMNLLTSSNTPFHEETPCVRHVPLPALSLLPFDPDEFSRLNLSISGQGFSSPSSNTPAGKLKCPRQRKRFSSPSSNTPAGKLKCPRQRKSHRWLPAGYDIVPGAEFCPDAVNEYLRVYNSKHRCPHRLNVNVRKHLAYLGWKIEFLRDEGFVRMRYTSRDGKSYNSLHTVCKALRERPLEILCCTSQDDKRISAAVSDGLFSSPLIEQAQASMEVSVMPSSSDVVVESEYCPQAVVEYYVLGSGRKNNNRRWYTDPKVKDMQFKATKHLSAVGWSLWYTMKGASRELRYSSPSGKCYYSLRTACKGCIDEGGVYDSNAFIFRPRQKINLSEEASGQLASERLSLALTDVESHGNSMLQDALSENWLPESAGISLSRELVELGKTKVRLVRKQQNKRMNGVPSLASHLFRRKDQNSGSRKLKKRKTSVSLIELRHDLGGDCPTRVLRSSKRARRVAVSSSSYQNPQTILSWLIDNNVVLPRAKVHYLGRKDRHPMAEGRITRDGIKCSCCQNVFTLSKFEVHAGSTYHRPAANIFLEDERSLLDCQSQLRRRISMRNLMTEPHDMKGRRQHNTNDYICSVCHFGGELVLCDQCPSSFHTSCLGLKAVPDGDWFCPSCCCGICGQSRFNRDTEQFMDNSVLSCDQCEHQYHVGCLTKRGDTNIDNYPKGSWFCNRRCKQIFLGLRKLLGRSVLVGEDNLTWTLLKNMKCDGDHDGSDIEALTENYSKLNVALAVMHECFEPVKEPQTRRDLVEDVIFSRWSELNRLNFRGFYTLLLERNDELISVATVRVHGEKVAEVPLVGTRLHYRRIGMCRILMNELEKKLMELGVERLVLPAVPSVLSTWTTSFGFSKMTEWERLNFLDYTFLDFQGTVMCQKLLMKIPSTESSVLISTRQNICDGFSRGYNIDLDGNSAISEVFQAEQVEESEIVDQGPADIAGVDGTDGGNGTAHLFYVVNQPTPENGICLECSVEGAGHKECENDSNGLFKCYKRRRIPACGR